jgi:phosphoglycolate phosphatase-like HAD superfamily hydrolase
VSGAREALDGALEEAGWTVALATGNWSGAASAKLASAAIREPRLGGFADDAHTRVGILTAAISACGADRDSKVVYVGDRPWDATAAAEAGIGFVGVGECMANGQDARTSGASVLADLADFSRLLGALEEQAKTVGRFT